MITVAWVLLMVALIVVNILEIREWKRAKRYAEMAFQTWKRSGEELEEAMKQRKEIEEDRWKRSSEDLKQRVEIQKEEDI